jgi:hypothetical protein
MTKKIRILIILNLFLASAAFAQTSAEFFAGSMPVKPDGPTTVSQTAQLLIDNGSLAPSGLFVTASLSNQQYSGLNTTADNAVVMFGATNNPNSAFPISRPVFTPMTEIGSATDGMFSNRPSGLNAGMQVAANYAFNLFSSVHHFAGLPAGANGVPTTNSRVYFANLTLTLSAPVTDPYIHLVALGGSSNAGLGFASEFDLVTPGITLEKVTGTTSLAVTPTQIKNGNISGINVSCLNNAAACGTVRLRGTNITTVTFKVFVRGDGSNTETWAVPPAHNGDQWLVGVSLPGELITTAAPVTISGRAMSESGRAIPGARITLTDSSGNARTATTNSLGYYSFSDLDAGETVILEISHKRYGFDQPTRVHTLVDNLSEINFVGLF